jgi:hypothetical protein
VDPALPGAAPSQQPSPANASFAAVVADLPQHVFSAFGVVASERHTAVKAL